jgi:hypothetical protein
MNPCPYRKSRSDKIVGFAPACDTRASNVHCHLRALLTSLSSMWRTRAALQVEILALRHQIGVLQRLSRTRPRLTPADRILWAALSRIS